MYIITTGTTLEGASAPQNLGVKKKEQEEKWSNLLLIASRNQNSNVVSALGTKHITSAKRWVGSEKCQLLIYSTIYADVGEWA